MNVDTKEHMINTENKDEDSISLIPSAYNKIETFDVIDPPINKNKKNNYSSISSNRKDNKISSKNITYPSNILSMLSFNWVYSLIRSIKKKNKLKFSYLGEVSEDYKSKVILNEIKPKWYGKYYDMMLKNIEEKNKSIYPLLMTLIMGNLGKILFALSIFLLMSGLDYFGILIFEELLGRFKENKEKNSRILFLQNYSLTKLVTYMILYKLFSLILERQTLFISEQLAFRTKTQLNLLIYDKLLKIPLYNTGKFNEGQIINLFQIDSASFGDLVDYTTYIVMVPFKIIYSVYLLFIFFKLAFIPGSIILIILATLFWVFGKKEEKLQNDNMKATDARMNITSRAFDMIKIIKLYSWEKLFKKKINQKREIELDINKKKLNIQVIVNAIYWAVEPVLCLVCVVFYNIIYGQMEVDKILTAFFVIEGFVDPLFSLPEFFICLYEAIVSLNRIQDFLAIKEYDKNQIEYFNNSNNKLAIEITHVDFGVEKNYENEIEKEENDDNDDNNENDDINEDNKLFPTELEEIESNEKFTTNFYEDIFNEENNSNNEKLVFSSNLENKLVISENKNQIENKSENKDINNDQDYKKIIKNKETSIEKIILLKDINVQILKGEHIGIIGEVGSGKTCLLNAFINNLQVFSKNKSKGNIKLCGKISFVSQSPWILNATVEENILFFNKKDEEKYKKVISICQLEPDLLTLPKGDQTEIGEKGLNLSGGQKARISVARAIYSNAEIYIFDDPLSALDSYVGMNLFKEVFNDYLKDKTFIITTHALQYLNFFDRIFYMVDGKIHWSGTFEEIKNQEFYEEFVKSIEKKKSGEIHDIKKEKNEEKENEEEEENLDDEESSKTNIIKYERKKTEKENREKISFSTLKTLIEYSGGYKYVLRMILANIVWKATEVYSDYYLSSWNSNTNIDTKENNRKLFIYTLIIIPSIVSIAFRQKSMANAYINYNIKMHDTLIDKLIGAPINLFHDITPRGHIISRLSKDLSDGSRVNNILSGTLRVFFQVLGSILVCAIFNFWTVPIMAFIITIEVMFSLYCLQPIREMSRMEGKYRTPLIGAFSESLYGLHIIRAFQYEDMFEEKFDNRMNDYFKICLFQSGISGWYGINLDLISFILLTFILISCSIFKEKYNSQSIGLLLSYSLNLIEYLFDIMQRFSRVSKVLVSVERCDNYTKVLQEKYPTLITDKRLKQYSTNNKNVTTFIPSGKITFNNYSVKYRPNTPIVLKNLNFEIFPQEKIGVVGRTGSGKSTLCLCMFRLLEADEGKILIDDIDISEIGLEMLRKNLTIIPQEPTIIEGTLRENVDPSNTVSDEEIKKVLCGVGLDYFLEDKNLDYQIENNGNNISIGEKQLICIARALIKKSKIILMDEATANIDYKTETFLQNSINEQLKDCTVITIAHRIKTIINYDRILVLNNGEIVEYDTPQNLLDKKGLFYQLYKESIV